MTENAYGSSVPLCDILSVAVINLEPPKSYNMPRQSARLSANTLEKNIQDMSIQKQVTHKNNERGNTKNGYSINTFYGKKPAIDILSEVMPDNSMKKRKTWVEKKIAPGKDEPRAAKQIKVQDSEQEKKFEVEDDGQEENLENLSEYEKMCRKNIEEKMAFLAALNFDEAKKDFLVASSALKPKPKPSKLHIKKKIPLTERRKSLRLQNISPEGQPLPKVEIAQAVVEEHPQKPHKPLTFEEVFRSENQSSEELVKDLSTLSSEELKFEPVPYSRYESYFQTMRVKSTLVAKVAPTRIFSVAIHPSTSKTLICAGSKYGHLSFWDMESKNPKGGVYVYEPHSRPINCVAFNISHPHQVISSSYDGTVRCGHLDAGVFDEVYYTDEEDGIRCSYFDFLSSDSLLVGLSTGEVAVVDMRTPKHNEEIHVTHSCPIKTVSVHPVQKDYFICAGRNGIVSLWDLRLVKKKSVADMVLSRSVNSAYFSPLTGNSVLTTSMDNKLCLFDTTHLDGTVCLKKTIRHDNFTGRWLTGFRAVWLPNTEDAFIVGSMLQPRRIEVYRTNGVIAHNFSGEDLGSVCSINAFHPTKPILAGANSSGKLHVFTGKA